jgi:hypothetical protein
MKHIGIIENVGKRCIVVFREIYDERGNVIEPDNCLVVETDTLPDFAHQSIMAIVESEPAQTSANLYDVFARTRLSDGSVALSWLASNGRLTKVKTNNVVLVPDSSNKIRLSTVNRIINLEKNGYSQKDIERILQEDTPVKERKQSNKVEEKIEEPKILSDEEIATRLLNQANELLKEAERMKTQAYSLVPSLDPSSKQVVVEKEVLVEKPKTTVKTTATKSTTKPTATKATSKDEAKKPSPIKKAPAAKAVVK